MEARRAATCEPTPKRITRTIHRRDAQSGTLAAMSDLDALARRLEQFADARDWAQFHTPKNLAMALAGEVGELVAEFQWLTPEQAATVMAEDAEAAARIRAELGDVTNYLVRLADVLGVDLIQAANAKIDANEKRYPADTYRGSIRKAPS